MPKIANAKMDDSVVERFSVSILGDHQFGTNSVGVWVESGKIRVNLSNAFDKQFDGAGVIDAQMSNDDIGRASDVFGKLCKASGASPANKLPIDTLNIYSINCMQDGKPIRHQGRLSDLQRDLALEVFDFYQKSLEKYIRNGRAIERIGVTVSEVQREKEDFLVGVTFVNGGQYAISMRTPDQWKAIWQEKLDIGGKRIEGTDEWRASLAGLQIANKAELSIKTENLTMGESGTFVTIPAGGSVTFKFRVRPHGKIPKGTYKFGVLIVTTMTTLGDAPNLSRVNFGSNSEKSPSFTFDTDYPSTPDEWNDYEAHQRQKMSSQPVRPGEAVVEPGYYRNVSASGERGQFVVGLLRGERTATLDRASDRWVWDADLALEARCKPGKPCAREGRWVARTLMMGLGDRDETHPEFERYMRVGEIAPELSSLGGYAPYHYWQWLGV
ncbi:hypothetical protein LMG27952_04492 [Paraburkholderia hiiakae]|uniref:Uncharacterized protein n=2 Tax=Paraburkholderia hiiakae TaxID=1081782 RepID=A0ABM8NWN8_9BURK|nr:hypothetical protein LMG27952_04492 [Paraburkholderia hiiakae]